MWTKLLRNEFVKIVKHPQIKWLYLGCFVFVLLFAYRLSTQTSPTGDALLINTLNQVSPLFFMTNLLAIPFISVTFFSIVDVEFYKQKTFKLQNIPVNPIHIFTAKFIAMYAVYVVIWSLALGLAYTILLTSVDNTFLGSTLQVYFINVYIHYLLLAIPIFLTFFLVNLFVRNYFLTVLIWFLLIVISNTRFILFKPFTALKNAINLELAIVKYNNLYRVSDILNLYYIAFAWCFLALIITYFFGKWKKQF